MNIKKFIKEHKKEIMVIGGGVLLTVVGIVVFKNVKDLKLHELEGKTILKALSSSVKDHPIPNWEGMEIIEHWSESSAQNMILNCHVCQLGELGEHLMTDMVTQANPDIPIEMILSYGSSCWVGV